MQEQSNIHPWSFSRQYPVAVRTNGVYIYDEHVNAIWMGAAAR